MSRTSFRRSTLDKGSSTTNLGHAVINPRIRDRSTVVAQPRLLPWAAASGTSNIGKPGEHAVAPAMLENGHERRTILYKSGGDPIVAEVERLRWRIWNGKA